MLTWAMCDLTGATVAEAQNPLEGSQVTIPLNGRRAGSLTLAFEDPAAPEAYPLMRVVKCWLDGTLIAAGPVLKPRFSMHDRQVQIPFVDPSYRLELSYVNNRGDTNFNTGVGVLATQTAVAQGEIVARLMEHAKVTAVELAAGVPDIGIVRGTLQSGGVLRDRTYETGASVWAQMLDMAGVIDGIDIALTPQDRTDGVFAKLDTFYSQQGADKTQQATFEIGLGLDNATELVWEPAGDEVANRATVQGVYTEGQPPLFYQSNQPESQLDFGIYQSYEGRSDVLIYTTLQELAQGVASAHSFPADNFDITPAMDDGSGRTRNPSTGAITRLPGSYGRPPYLHPNGDYWLGDTIGVRAFDRPAIAFEGVGRVYEITLTQASDGAVVPTVKVMPPTIDATVT